MDVQKYFLKKEYGSSVNANTDEERDDIVISNSYENSSLYKESKGKTLPLNTAPLKSSKQSSTSAKCSSIVTFVDLA